LDNFRAANKLGLGLVQGGQTTLLPPLFGPYAINNAGQVAGSLTVNAHGGTDTHPAVYQNGQLTDLFSKVGNGQYYYSSAIAINQKGDMLLTVSAPDDSLHSYLYTAARGTAIDLTNLPGGQGMIGAALNNNSQVAGNGFLYTDGTLRLLASLIPHASGWSNLNATAINDAGQIVGQGSINGREHAFEMTPIAGSVPEPGTLALWGLLASAAAARTVARLV
jgi:uncharacterized membrane protein